MWYNLGMRFIAAAALSTLISTPCLSQPTAGMARANVSVCFTPAQQCEHLIIEALDGAKSSIRVQAYSFTSLGIVDALKRAAKRNVEVLVILDKTNDRKFAAGTLLEAAGIPVWIDYQPAIAHNKVIIVDSRLVIGGSFNYTASAERRNAENVTFTDSKTVASWYIKNWESRLKVSRALGNGKKPF